MDLTIRDVSNLLNVSESAVQHWLSEGLIPAYQINGEHRFSRLEIEEWLLHDQTLFRCSGDQGVSRGGTHHFCFYRALHQGGVFDDLSGRTKEELFFSVTRILAPQLGFDGDALYELLLDRERLMSTGLGRGVAVPHTRELLCKTPRDHVFVVYPEVPLDYGSLDGQEVHTLFFLFAGGDKGHLQLLAKLSHLANQEEALSLLRSRPSKKTLLEFVRHWEEGLLPSSGLVALKG